MQGDIRTIKTVTFYPVFAKMDVKYYGNFSDETLKRCVCCDKYHLITLEICPETNISIMEEEKQQTELKIRQTKAKKLRTTYEEKHLTCWKNEWQLYMAIFGVVVTIFMALFFIPKENNLWHVLFTAIFSAVWFLFWFFRFAERFKKIKIQANEIFQRTLNGEEVVV